MGVEFARAALTSGNALVATGRNPDAVTRAIGEEDDLLVIKLDVTSPADADATVQAAVQRFGRIDVLVNNAGSFMAGFYRTELLSPESTTFAELSLEDYAERTKVQNEWWKAQHRHQAGDPARRSRHPGIYFSFESAVLIYSSQVGEISRIDRYRIRLPFGNGM